MVEVVGELDFSEAEVELERHGVVQVLVEVERIHHTCDCERGNKRGFERRIKGGPRQQMRRYDRCLLVEEAQVILGSCWYEQ